jgi:hypothetical protein
VPAPSGTPTPDHFVTHLAMLEDPAEGAESEWGDLVTDEEYNSAR